MNLFQGELPLFWAAAPLIMCGIFGIIGESESPNKVFKGLSDIEYRGYDSWGVAFKVNNGFKIVKRIGFLPKKCHFPRANLALGHTRWATHGGVTVANAHPHSDCQDKLVLVHNGIVENYIELKSKLRDHQLKSETDTEVIIHLIEDQYKKTADFKQSVASIFRKLQGLNAIVVSDGIDIVACKNSSPLVVGQLRDGFVIASDPNATLPLTNKMLFLEDNQMICLNDQMELYNLSRHQRDLQEIKPKFTTIDWDYSSASLVAFPHFMIKEIYEQPKILGNIAKNGRDITHVASLIKKAFGTFLIACGSASYACLAGAYLFSKFAKKHVNFSVGSEFTYIQDYLTPRSLLIAVSQSGESMDTVEPVTFAKKKGAKIIALVNVLGSTLFRMADYPVLLNAGVEKAVCSTKALSAMLAFMILLSFTVAGKRKQAERILLDSAKEVENIIKKRKEIAKLASKILHQEHIYVLGRGLSYPVALEATLKIKEVSYIHAEGFAAGELKHGVIAMIEKGTPVICFVPNDETKGAILANAMEVKARGAYIIGVGPESSEIFDFHFKVKDVGASSIIPHVVFAQFLGYFLAIKLKVNPDKPRNLAKSVVVR